MIDAGCRNCETPLRPGQRFCGACGQRITAGRLTMGQIATDVVHVLTHADHSIFALIKSLAIHPGRVAREYVEGRRKKYFGPFAFVLITVGLASFVILVTGIQWIRSDAESPAVRFLQQHINLMIVLQIPLLAGSCALLFWNSRLNYAEHLVFAAYTSGFRGLILALVAAPAFYFTRAASTGVGLMTAYFGLWLAYFAFAAAQFYRGGTAWKVIRAIIAAMIAQLLTFTLLIAVVVVSFRLTS